MVIEVFEGITIQLIFTRNFFPIFFVFRKKLKPLLIACVVTCETGNCHRMFCDPHSYYRKRGNISSGFSNNFEAFASELLENHEYMFPFYCKHNNMFYQICYDTGVLPLRKSHWLDSLTLEAYSHELS